MPLLACAACQKTVEFSDVTTHDVVACCCGVVLQFPAFLVDGEKAENKTYLTSAAEEINDSEARAQQARVIRLPEKLPYKRKPVGVPEKNFHSVEFWAWIWLGVGVVWLLGWMCYVGTNPDAFKLTNDKLQFILVIAGPIFAPLLIFLGARGLLYPADLLVCSDGILYVQHNASRLIPWDDVDFLWIEWQEVEGINKPRENFALHLRNGDKIAFNSIGGIWFDNARQVIDTFWARMNAHDLAKAHEALEAGQEFDFKAVTVGPAGLRRHGELLSWDEIGVVAVHDTHIWIYKKDAAEAHWKIPTERMRKTTPFLELMGERVPVTDALGDEGPSPLG